MTRVQILQAAIAGPTAAAVLWLLLVRWPLIRRLVALLVATASLAAGGWVFWLVYRGDAVVWRGFAPTLLGATLASAAGVAMLLAALRADDAHRGVAAPVVVALGAAASAVVAAAYTQSLVLLAVLVPLPTLAAAVAAVSGRGRRDALGFIGLALADAVTLVGLSVIYARTDTAVLSASTGLGVGLVLGAAAAKAGALPGLATWRLSATGGPGSILAVALRGQGLVLAAAAGAQMARGERMAPMVVAAASVVFLAGLVALATSMPSSTSAAVLGTAFGLPFLALGLGGTIGIRSFLVLVPTLLIAGGVAVLLVPADPQPAAPTRRRRTPAKTPATKTPARKTSAKKTPARRKSPAAPRPATSAAFRRRRTVTERLPEGSVPPVEPPLEGAVPEAPAPDPPLEGGEPPVEPPAGPTSAPPRRGFLRRGPKAVPAAPPVDEPAAPPVPAPVPDPAAAAAAAPDPEATGAPDTRAASPRRGLLRRKPKPSPTTPAGEAGASEVEPKPAREPRPPLPLWGWLSTGALGVALGSLLGLPPGGGFPGTWLALSLSAARAEESPGWLLVAAGAAVGLAMAAFAMVGLLRASRRGPFTSSLGFLLSLALLYVGTQPVRLGIGWWIRIETALDLPEVLPSIGAPGLPPVGGLNLLLTLAPALGIGLLLVAMGRGFRDPGDAWVPFGGPSRTRRVQTPARARLARIGGVLAPVTRAAGQLRAFGVGYAIAVALEVVALLIAGRLVLLAAEAGFL
jgi:hypothetical protein